MKFHKVLAWITGINFGAAMIFFYILYRNLPYANDRGLNVGLGWIGWLAMLTFIIPGCVSDAVRGEWFSKGYGVGSLLLLLLMVFGTIAGSVIAYMFVK
jgi:hypothetical protein